MHANVKKASAVGLMLEAADEEETRVVEEEAAVEKEPNKEEKSVARSLRQVPARRAAACDAAIAEFFFLNNIEQSVIDHPAFEKMVSTLLGAPPSYAPPDRRVVRACVRERAPCGVAAASLPRSDPSRYGAMAYRT